MCYAVPLVAALTTNFVWKKKKTLEFWWLFLMFCGSSVFGVIDHLWNGELFLISENWLKDLGLGFVITAGTILVWKIILAKAKRNPVLAS
jgi:hypothetical protein